MTVTSHSSTTPLLPTRRAQGYLRISVAADKDVTMVRQRRAETTTVWSQFDDIQSIRAELSQVEHDQCPPSSSHPRSFLTALLYEHPSPMYIVTTSISGMSV